MASRGICTDEVLQELHHYETGDAVHPKYVIPPGHEIYDIRIGGLTSPGAGLNAESVKRGRNRKRLSRDPAKFVEHTKIPWNIEHLD